MEGIRFLPLVCVFFLFLTFQLGYCETELTKDEAVTLNSSLTEIDVTWEDLNPGLVPVAEVYLASENENLTLLSKDGNSEIHISQETLRNNKGFQNIVLVCNAFFPIQWIYKGDGTPLRMYSSEIRTFEDFENRSSYEYFSTLVLMPERNNEHFTGTYICQKVDDPESQTYYHLYFSGEFGFPTIRNRIVSVPPNETQVTIPCMTTNPEAKMSFYKIYPKKEAGKWTNNTALTFDPKIGYKMDLSKIPNPYGTYYCSVNDQLSFWKVELVPPIDEGVQVEPESTLIQMESFKNQTFRCSSKENIKLVFPNSGQVGTLEYIYNETDAFPYSAILRLESSIPITSVYKYLRINCITERTGRVLQSWKLSSIGEEGLIIKYVGQQSRILCCTKSGLSPVYEFVKCETRTDCQMKSHCFKNGRCEYPFPPRYVSAPPGCVGVEFSKRVPTHVAKCSVGDESRIVPISENIHRSDILMDEGAVPETESILKLMAIMDDKSEVKFKCAGSLYYFSTNFVFAVEKVDGSLVYATSDSIDMAESHEPVFKTKMDPTIKRIICFAPLTFSLEWKNVSMPVSVSEPVKSRKSTSSSFTTNARFGFIRRRTQT